MQYTFWDDMVNCIVCKALEPYFCIKKKKVYRTVISVLLLHNGKSPPGLL